MICKRVSFTHPSRLSTHGKTNLDFAIQDFLQRLELGIYTLVVDSPQQSCALLNCKVGREGNATAHGMFHGLVTELCEE